MADDAPRQLTRTPGAGWSRPAVARRSRPAVAAAAAGIALVLLAGCAASGAVGTARTSPPASAGMPRPSATPAPTPTPAPTADDLADPDDPALNAGAAADLAAPAPAGSVSTSTLLAAATGRTALVALGQLAVDDNPSMSGYVRDAFGYRAYDTDHNGCDTRNDILRRDLTGVALKDGTGGCVVLSGTLADPYSGTSIAFTRGTATSNDVQIDHVVALGDAWQSGAAAWSDDRRHLLGNDRLNLLAVSGPLNSQKGDKAANAWLPPSTGYRCSYVARQVGVKLTYGLTVTTSERDAMAVVLSSCREQPLPDGSTLPVAVAAPTKAPAPPAVAPPAAPAPPRAPAQPPAPVAPKTVTAGAFCSPAGATGVTKNGIAMVCGTYAKSPDRARWHQP